MSDHYLIEVRKGTGDDAEIVRAHKAHNVDDAIGLIEGLRDAAVGRDNVTWQNEEVDNAGAMYGLAPGGLVWEIHVTPPLTEELA
jgi:hypothetical protein